jgi:hypothetical protein
MQAKLIANQEQKLLEANEKRQLLIVTNHTFNSVVTINCGIKQPIAGHGFPVQIGNNPAWTGEVSAIASIDVEIEIQEL